MRIVSLRGDTQLIARLAANRWPSFAQWKYLPRFLSLAERIAVIVACLLVGVSLIAVALRLYVRSTVRVPAPGGTYTEALIGYPRFLNPVLAPTNDVDLDLTHLLFSGLFRRTASLTLEPDLIQNFSISDDQKTYTFTLREGLTFDDGEPLTARDVQFTIEAIQDPDWRSPLAPLLRGVIVDVIDERIFTLTLRESFAPFLENLTFGILPAHIWSDVAPAHAAFAEENVRPVGAGLYRVAAFTKQEDIITSFTLERNTRSHRTPPLIDRIVFKFYSDHASALAALTNKQVDGVSVVPGHLQNLIEREHRITEYTIATPQYMTLLFRNAPLVIVNDRGTREGLFLAVDRSRIVRDVLKTNGAPAGSLIPKGALGYDPSIEPLPYDPKMARDALEAAGWKELAREGYEALWEKQERERRDRAAAATATSTAATTEPAPVLPEPTLESYWERNGQVLVITLTIPDSPELIAIAELIKSGWEALGVPTDIIAVPTQRFGRDVIQPGAYSALLTTILVGADPDPYPFWHSSQVEYPGLNLAHFVNHDVDMALEEARKTTKTEERATRYKKFQEIFRKELPALVIANLNYRYAVDRRIEGIAVDRMLLPADRFATIASWYVKTKRIWK